MRIHLIFAAAVCAAAAVPAAAGVSPSGQPARLAHNASEGEITVRGATRLERLEGRIARFQVRSIASGRGVSERERLRIEAMEDRAAEIVSGEYRPARN